MPIPKSDQWLQIMHQDVQQQSNPLVADVGKLLDVYWAVPSIDAKASMKKQKILVLLVYYCEKIIHLGISFHYVDEVVNAIKKELRTEEMLQATQQRLSRGDNPVHMKEHDVEILQPRNPIQKHKLTTDVIGGRRMTGAAVENLQHTDDERVLGITDARKMDRESFDTIDMLQLLASLNAAHQLDGLEQDLVYLTKAERDQFKLNLQGRNFHRGGAEALFDTHNKTEVFVMDEMHYLYVLDEAGVGGRTVHHSSVRSGKSVLCAGMMKVTRGQIIFISNGSGHYLPDKVALYNCVKILKDEYRINCSSLKVEWVYGEDKSVDCGDANNFLSHWQAIDENYVLPRRQPGGWGVKPTKV